MAGDYVQNPPKDHLLYRCIIHGGTNRVYAIIVANIIDSDKYQSMVCVELYDCFSVVGGKIKSDVKYFDKEEDTMKYYYEMKNKYYKMLKGEKDAHNSI